VEEFLREFGEEADGGSDEWLPGSVGDADIADVERERAEAFVRVDFGAASVFEDGDGAIADVEIEFWEGVGNGVGVVIEAAEFGAGGERGFEHFGEQEGAEEFVFGDVCEEVGVV
jgi:hypothetical protein